MADDSILFLWSDLLTTRYYGLKSMIEFNRTFFYIFLFISCFAINAQVANDCSNAIPICNNTPVNGGTNGFGIDDFAGLEKTGCLEPTLEGKIESNSAWYRFRTNETGQLGFNIGFNSAEDWDFALYKSSDCNALEDPVRCNFFDNTEMNSYTGVGEDPTGDLDNFQYDDWVEVVPGEEYYLLINNFSNTNSGFSIQFTGTIFITYPDTALDCSIVDNLLGPPISACEGDNITLDATLPDALAYTWSQDLGTGYSELTGETSSVLSVITTGNYLVEVSKPGNNIVKSDVQVVFSQIPTAFPIADVTSCSDIGIYNLAQKDAEVMGTQDSSMYIIGYYNSLADAENASNVLPKQYEPQEGTETIYVRVSAVNNTSCYDVSSFQFINLNTPSLDFPSEAYLCEGGGSVFIGESNPNPNYSYRWNTGQTASGFSTSEDGFYTLTVTNTNADFSCEVTKTIHVTESKPPIISDIEINGLRANNTVKIITNAVEGQWEYQLNNGPIQSSNLFENVNPGMYTVTVTDVRGCGTATAEIVVVGFYKFFTPNNDRSYDTWKIEGITTLNNAQVTIFDRYGKLLYFMGSSNTEGWDGSYNGVPMPEGDYWFKLTYTNVAGQEQQAKYIANHFALKR